VSGEEEKYHFQKGGGISIVFRPKYRPLIILLVVIVVLLKKNSEPDLKEIISDPDPREPKYYESF
jgi:hypothetical protein